MILRNQNQLNIIIRPNANKILYLVTSTIFQFRERVAKGRDSDEWKNEGCGIPAESMRNMFNNISAIYQFHKDFLMPPVMF